MTVTFRQLEVFVEAAKDNNFRKTADRLGISQPSISNQIRALEARAGYQLFDRSRGSTPRLSTDGTAFLRKAQDLLAGKSKLARAGSAKSKGQRLTLRIAAGPFLLDHYIRPALPRFLERHKHFVLDFLPPAAVRQMGTLVQRGEADVATYTGSRSARKRPGSELICEIPCSLYGSARMARLASKDTAAISTLPFILPMEGSESERWVLSALKKAGISPVHVVARSQFSDVIAGMITNGKGVSMLFDEQMADSVSAGRAFRLGPALESGSRVLLVGRRARTKAAAPFVEFLRRLLKREL